MRRDALGAGLVRGVAEDEEGGGHGEIRSCRARTLVLPPKHISSLTWPSADSTAGCRAAPRGLLRGSCLKTSVFRVFQADMPGEAMWVRRFKPCLLGWRRSDEDAVAPGFLGVVEL